MWLLSVFLVFTLIAASCGNDDDEPAAPPVEEAPPEEAPEPTQAPEPTPEPTEVPMEEFTIGFVSIWCANPTVCGVNRSFIAETEAAGHRAIVIEADLNDAVNSQIAGMDQLIAQGVDAIAFWPLDDAAMQAPMQRAADAGIPLFSHDMYNDPTGLVISSVVQGRELKAKQSAALICQALGDDGGQVLYGNFAIEAIPTLVFLKEKFIEYLSGCEGAELVGTFLNETDDVDGGQPAAEAALLANPDVEAVFAYNDPTAIGTSIAATSLGRDIYIDGYNLSQDGVDALAAGRFDVSWDYRSADIGQALARTMVQYLDGTNSSPPLFTTVWPIAYTPETIGDFMVTDERLELINDGVFLLDLLPEFVTSGTTIPAPADEIPLPELAG
jgi:ribose transport system substrate-binding protein